MIDGNFLFVEFTDFTVAGGLSCLIASTYLKLISILRAACKDAILAEKRYRELESGAVQGVSWSDIKKEIKGSDA